MLWQSYPIVWMVAGLMLAVMLLRRMFRRLHVNVVLKTDGRGIRYQRKYFIVSSLALGLLAYGSLTLQPLQWKAAFRYNDSFKSYLALNPLQNFFTTLRFRRPQYSEAQARSFSPVIRNWMGLPGTEFSYKRKIEPVSSIPTKPNIVLVVCESFSMYKSSMSGNRLNTTPYFQSLADSGIFFNRCFTPHFSTARGLFATLTGIPDVQLSKFSTRNPEALDQHTIVNDFRDYSKYYFLGGSPSFNNFGGLVHNIDGIRMNVEGNLTGQPVNVWGISDKDLFLQANSAFAKESSPFFAIIQTADNHRPFTIPAVDSGFKKKNVSPEELEQYGFESPEEYNSFRYADYCFEQFMEAAKKEKYFSNTIFVFIGDHGVSGNARKEYPEVWTRERLTDEHVPLLFYSPSLLQPQKRNEVVSQIDVLPSIAGLAGISYTNTTLGRDVIHNQGQRHYAFIILHDEGRIGMVTDDFYFTRNLNFFKEELHPLDGRTYTARQKDSISKKMSEVTTGFYETAKWMLVHNKK
jgi:phosphoglycerol transferase MdoB-like AlkP superfamily enzyme